MKTTFKNLSLILFIVIILNSGLLINAQNSAKVTKEDYARAEKFLSASISSLVLNSNIRAEWINDYKFIYKKDVEKGHEFILVDAQKGKQEKAFNHDKLDKALSK